MESDLVEYPDLFILKRLFFFNYILKSDLDQAKLAFISNLRTNLHPAKIVCDHMTKFYLSTMEYIFDFGSS